MKEIEKVDLRELFEEKAKYNKWLLSLTSNEFQCIIDLMKESTNQAIDLCSDNADADYTYLGDDLKTIGAEYIEVYVLKNSILNVKNLIQ